MSCPWLKKRESKDFEKTTKYSQLRQELTNRYPEYKVTQYNIIMDVLYGVRSGTKSILRFRGFGNTSWLRKLFFESLSVVFGVWVPCLRVVASLVSSYCFLPGTAGFSSWRRYGLKSSLRHFYVFVSSGLPFVDCATYLGRYLMYVDIYCTDFTCISC